MTLQTKHQPSIFDLTEEDYYAMFFDKVWKTDFGCWLWTGWVQHRYARIRRQGKQRGVHRYAYEYFVGGLADSDVVDHVCMNTPCVNPLHLQAVSGGENVRRSIKLGRQKPGRCRRGHVENEEAHMEWKGIDICKECGRLTSAGQFDLTSFDTPHT